MTWQAVTGLVIAGGLALAVVYDLLVFALGGDRATISRVLLGVSRRYPGFSLAVAALVGMLLGHLFLPQHVP